MTFVVSSSDRGDFVGGKLAWDVLRRTAQHRSDLPNEIDLGLCLHLKPYSVACLVALGAKGANNIHLKLPNDANCREHLIRLGLPKWFRCDVPNEEVVQRPTNVLIKQLMGSGAGDFADLAMDVWERELGGLSVGKRAEFSTHIDEVILNALGHAASAVGCIVVGQAFPTNNYLEVAIIDLGVTIRGSLKRNPLYANKIPSDIIAIRLALEEGVTGTPPGATNLIGQPNSGVGLTELAKYCIAGNGVLTIQR
jgi:hypothetical protein